MSRGMLRELNGVLRELRSLAIDGDAAPAVPLGRRCARLALVLLEEGPEAKDRNQIEDPFSQPTDSTASTVGSIELPTCARNCSLMPMDEKSR